jgi:hypothetical protein
MAVKKSTDAKEKEEIHFDETPTKDVMSSEMYSKLLEDLRKEITEELKKDSSIGQVIDEHDDDYNPKEDYLDKPAIFFSFNTWYCIYGDKRYNREVLPPRGEKVEFKKLYRYPKRTGGRTAEVISVSQAIVRSKSTADWLRDHSKFGIKFFEDMGKAQKVNITLAEKMSEMSNVVSSMNDHGVIERCTREGISVETGDLAVLRKALIRRMAENALKTEKHQHEIKIRAAADEAKNVENRKMDIDNDIQAVSAYE